MASPSKKSLTEAQRRVLVELITEHKTAVQQKMHDAYSNQRKSDAWLNITRRFNVMHPNLEEKSTAQLKRAWEYIRAKIKKDHSRYMRKKMGTGGGPPPSPPKYSELETAAVGVMADELEFAETQYDSLNVSSAQALGATQEEDSAFIISEADVEIFEEESVASSFGGLSSISSVMRPISSVPSTSGASFCTERAGPSKEPIYPRSSQLEENPDVPDDESQNVEMVNLESSAKSTPKTRKGSKSGKSLSKEDSLRLIQERQDELHKVQLDYYSNYSRQVDRVADTIVLNVNLMSSRLSEVADAVIKLANSASARS